MGLEEIISELQKESNQEYDNIIQSAKIMALKAISEKKSQLDNQYNEKRINFDNDLFKQKKKMIAKIDLERIKEKQNIESKLIDEIIIETFDDFVNYLRNNKEKYLNLLNNLMEKTISIIDQNKIEISFNNEDENLIKKLISNYKYDFELKPSNKIKGGFICISGNSYIDNSLETIFLNNKIEIIKIIRNYFEKANEDSNE